MSISKITKSKVLVNPYEPFDLNKLTSILDLIVKKDIINKIVVFYTMLSAYTQDSQLNASFNAPSSTGKTFIPLMVLSLFPKEDAIVAGYCSPTAFFHDYGEYNSGTNTYFVDLENKILIFLDQPHSLLLQRLRPLLSHDRKEVQLKITDKSQKGGLRTKNIIIKGFPATIFCTGNLKMDEQEATRFILLSPEMTQKKYEEGIKTKIWGEADKKRFQRFIEDNPDLNALRERVKAIKAEGIEDIKILNEQRIEDEFFKRNRFLKSRDQRDIGYIISFIKTNALLNLWDRDRDGSTIIANDEDITVAFKIWDKVCKPLQYGIPPYIFRLFSDVFIPLWKEKSQHQNPPIGLSRREIQAKYYQMYHRPLPDWQLRQEIIPMLESAGLIYQEPNPANRREMLIYLTW